MSGGFIHVWMKIESAWLTDKILSIFTCQYRFSRARKEGRKEGGQKNFFMVGNPFLRSRGTLSLKSNCVRGVPAASALGFLEQDARFSSEISTFQGRCWCLSCSFDASTFPNSAPLLFWSSFLNRCSNAANRSLRQAKFINQTVSFVKQALIKAVVEG